MTPGTAVFLALAIVGAVVIATLGEPCQSRKARLRRIRRRYPAVYERMTANLVEGGWKMR